MIGYGSVRPNEKIFLRKKTQQLKKPKGSKNPIKDATSLAFLSHRRPGDEVCTIVACVRRGAECRIMDDKGTKDSFSPVVGS
ncbi:hypothetical protein EYZ11_007532 [Aspergillus tanneri]|uniref:Uncharacterized protein n=1 Tax=Aspergillus tanneri TaxID=1220188 RepID=A0A4S3JF32_9EURO|nr:uncharacterized protein ATNIH1004_000817 [Aspergillus tanneri]KAA8651918.1 hypothetical protein ATNIH1004_000817 [Aspergillus tanneri]THC92998.1 hypothetical protein EYZ11_007532 [Aspergillus tanneri]